MKTAQQKGLEELEDGREGGGGAGEREGEEDEGCKEERNSPPPVPLSRKNKYTNICRIDRIRWQLKILYSCVDLKCVFPSNSGKKVKTTSKKTSKRLQLQTPAKGATENVKVKARVTRTSRKLKAPPVVGPDSDEEKENLELNGDDDSDFKTDVLTSARRALANSGSLTRRKPVRRVRGRKIRQLVFSSDEEDEQSEEEEKGKRQEGEREEENPTVPPRFTLSDDDI